MRVSVFGAGYVGVVTAATLAENGHNVLCVDIDESKINSLRSGRVPFYEPRLEEVIKSNIAGERLSFSSEVPDGISHGQVIFIAVGTPPLSDGSADLCAVVTIATSIGQHMSEPKIVVDKSTVPVGTSNVVKAAISRELLSRNVDFEFHVVSNPEFLKEGSAVDDALKPDRIIVGAESENAFHVLREIFSPFVRRDNVLIEMDPASAELTKYASNAMLASRISLMNELSRLAEKTGADIENVRRGVGSDSRIGPSFLYAGAGFGGSCFPKDVSALIATSRSLGLEPHLLTAINKVNTEQQDILFEKIRNRFQEDLASKTITVWGLSFKPDTDDMRNSPSLPLIRALVEAGAKVQAYDPVATQNARTHLSDFPQIVFSGDKYSALHGSNALVLVTEWKEFRAPDFDFIIKTLVQPVVFDGRNQWDPANMAGMGFEYFPIGRGANHGSK